MVENFQEFQAKLQRQMGQLGKENPAIMKGIGQLHKAALAEGVLSSRTKELVALGIAIAVRCEGCISTHVRDALKLGVTRAELLETIGVAVLMGGGPSVVYGSQALDAFDQFAPATEESLGEGLVEQAELSLEGA